MTHRNPLDHTPLEGKPLRKLATEGASGRRQGGAENRGAAAPSGVESPLGRDDSDEKRRQLVALLWGEPEEDSIFDHIMGRDEEEESTALTEPLPPAALPAPPKPETPKPGPPKPAPPSHSEAAGADKDASGEAGASESKVFSRVHRRRACSFPGLIRIMVPEQSFQPRVLAVRLVDLSPSGARLETRQLNESFCTLLKEQRRFARLEAMVPSRDRLMFGGTIAWAEHGEELSSIGFQFQDRHDEVEDVFLDEFPQASSVEEIALPSPRIDPFPNLTSMGEFRFSGTVVDAELVVARMGPKEVKATPVGGSFELVLPLKPDRSNFISFTAVSGDRSSIPTPVCIVHKTGAAETNSLQNRPLVEQWEREVENDVLRVKLQGTAPQFHRVLRALEEALGHVDGVEMTVELKGNSRAAADVLESLRKKPG